MVRRWHRRIGLLLSLQVVLWVLTGLLFNVKHRYNEYLVQLVPPAPAPRFEAPLIPPARPVEKLWLRYDGIRYHWLAQEEGKVSRWDPKDGTELPPLTLEECRELAASAILATPVAPAFGTLGPGSRSGNAFSSLSGEEHDTVTFETDTGKIVQVIPETGEISHTSALHTFIDWTYRIHYMQYTSLRWVNISLVLSFITLTLVLVCSGWMLALPRTRQ